MKQVFQFSHHIVLRIYEKLTIRFQSQNLWEWRRVKCICRWGEVQNREKLRTIHFYFIFSLKTEKKRKKEKQKQRWRKDNKTKVIQITFLIIYTTRDPTMKTNRRRVARLRQLAVTASHLYLTFAKFSSHLTNAALFICSDRTVILHSFSFDFTFSLSLWISPQKNFLFFFYFFSRYSRLVKWLMNIFLVVILWLWCLGVKRKLMIYFKIATRSTSRRRRTRKNWNN